MKAIESKIKPPTAQETWSEIYLLPYKITKEPYFQSLQYKILNRILNCNERLYKWNIIEKMYVFTVIA